jgi:hypothetical protein
MASAESSPQPRSGVRRVRPLQTVWDGRSAEPRLLLTLLKIRRGRGAARLQAECQKTAPMPEKSRRIAGIHRSTEKSPANAGTFCGGHATGPEGIGRNQKRGDFSGWEATAAGKVFPSGKFCPNDDVDGPKAEARHFPQCRASGVQRSSRSRSEIRRPALKKTPGVGAPVSGTLSHPLTSFTVIMDGENSPHGIPCRV